MSFWLSIRTLVSILLLENVSSGGGVSFFKGHITIFSAVSSGAWSHTLFPFMFCSYQSSCFCYKFLHPLGSPMFWADSLPEMRYNACIEVAGCVPSFCHARMTQAILSAGNSSKRYSLTRATYSLAADVEKHFILERNLKVLKFVHHELCWILAMAVSTE